MGKFFPSSFPCLTDSLSASKSFTTLTSHYKLNPVDEYPTTYGRISARLRPSTILRKLWKTMKTCKASSSAQGTTSSSLSNGLPRLDDIVLQPPLIREMISDEQGTPVNRLLQPVLRFVIEKVDILLGPQGAEAPLPICSCWHQSPFPPWNLRWP